MNLSTVLPMLYAGLNAAGAADLVFWSADELYRYADAALNELSRKTILFVDWQELPLPANQPAYDLAHLGDAPPADTRFCSLIHIACAGATLTASNVRELEALDANWQTAASVAAPSNWIGDYLGPAIIGIYPAPVADSTLTVVAQRSAPQISAASPSTDAPDTLADLLHLRILAEARRKRSDAWMPEAASLADQIADTIEKAFAAYYGAAL